MALVLWEFNRSFHIVKYLSGAVIVWLGQRVIVPGRQNWDRRAVSSACKVRWVCVGRGLCVCVCVCLFIYRVFQEE